MYATWKELTDPNAFQPDLPLAFRDAYTLAWHKGRYLGREAQVELANRLRSVPSAKVSRQVRGALNRGRTDEERIGLVTEVLDEAGITVTAAKGAAARHRGARSSPGDLDGRSRDVWSCRRSRTGFPIHAIPSIRDWPPGSGQGHWGAVRAAGWPSRLFFSAGHAHQSDLRESRPADG